MLNLPYHNATLCGNILAVPCRELRETETFSQLRSKLCGFLNITSNGCCHMLLLRFLKRMQGLLQATPTCWSIIPSFPFKICHRSFKFRGHPGFRGFFRFLIEWHKAHGVTATELRTWSSYVGMARVLYHLILHRLGLGRRLQIRRLRVPPVSPPLVMLAGIN